MTPTSRITTRLKSARSGFTLIEILAVTAIIAMMAVMVMPRGIFSFVTPLRAMQRTIIEITDLAMNGHSVRLCMEAAERSDRGRITAEILTQVEDTSNPSRHMLEWRPVELVNLPEGEDWRLEPEIIYFFSDGACTPGVVMRADEGERITEGDFAMITATGFLYEPEVRMADARNYH